MHDSWTPLLETEPQRFHDLIFSVSGPDERRSRYPSVADALLGEIVRYGALVEEAGVPDLRAFYRWCVHEIPVEIRRSIAERVKRMRQHPSMLTVNAYLPFIMAETDRLIVSTASVDWSSEGELTAGDPMSRPRDLVNLILSGEPANPGAVFGGLLHLGDPRVCALLWPVRPTLRDEDANEAVKCVTGFLSSATIDFVLSWMESIPADVSSALFGILASNLALQRRHLATPFVFTGERPFPFASVPEEARRAMVKPVPIAAYTKAVAPRFRALEAAEPAPKVMTEVLAMWGIT
jgi:hypothetical protein